MENYVDINFYLIICQINGSLERIFQNKKSHDAEYFGNGDNIATNKHLNNKRIKNIFKITPAYYILNVTAIIRISMIS